jgi:hypothetical protein
MTQTSESQGSAGQDQAKHGSVTVEVNNKRVKLESHRVTGIEIKRAAIAQGVEIQEDFLLTLEATKGRPARTVDDDETVTVTKKSEFSANDGDDDS